MKKKSPPYAIIAAVILGIVGVALFLKHEKDQAAAQQAATDKLKADMAQQIADLQKNNVAPSINVTPANQRNVLYAKQTIEPGIKLSPAFYEKKLTNEGILPDAYVDGTDITGYYATRHIETGDPLTPRNIGKTLPYMSQRIQPGYRLLALPIFNADANSTGGFVVDGDKVDLFYTTPTSTQMVMQNLDVLYVPGPPVKTDQSEGINPIPTPGEPISVAFQVSPEQAQALIYLSQSTTGRFSMLLKSRKDQTEIKVKPFTMADYEGNLKKLQRTTDTAKDRVDALAAQIAEEEKKTSGNTNETTPTPPSTQ